MNKTMTVTYYHHSGFSVASGDILLVFDYWRGKKVRLPDELGVTPEDIKELEDLLENAVIMDDSNIDTSSVSLGSTVKVYDADLDMEIVYSLVGSNEADPAEGKISDQSPIGEALIGKREGDSVQVEVPNGTVRMKILAVSRTQN